MPKPLKPVKTVEPEKPSRQPIPVSRSRTTRLKRLKWVRKEKPKYAPTHRLNTEVRNYVPMINGRIGNKR